MTVLIAAYCVAVGLVLGFAVGGVVGVAAAKQYKRKELFIVLAHLRTIEAHTTRAIETPDDDVTGSKSWHLNVALSATRSAVVRVYNLSQRKDK